jgi:protein subunit release factor B
MKRLSELEEADLEEQFSRSSGPGGQHVNKSDTRVQLTHRPTGMTVTVQDCRSRQKNRQIARERLLEKINQEWEKIRLERRQERERKRRRSRPRPRALKEKILKSKKQRSEVKANRKRPDY